MKQSAKMQSRKCLGKRSPGRDPPRAVEGSTSRSLARLGDPCKGPQDSKVKAISTRPCTIRAVVHGPCGLAWRLPWAVIPRGMPRLPPRGSTRAVEGFTTRGAFRGGHALASQGTKVKAQLHETLNGPWGTWWTVWAVAQVTCNSDPHF